LEPLFVRMLELCRENGLAKMAAKALVDTGCCAEESMAVESPELKLYVSARKEHKQHVAKSGCVIAARLGVSQLKPGCSKTVS